MGKQLNIKSDVLYAKVERLAELTGTSLTGAVESAVDERLARAEREQDFEARMQQVRQRVNEISRNLVGPPIASTDIGKLLYDDDGLPGTIGRMVIDTSALVAIALDEPECDMFTQAILKADRALLSAANWFEATIVLDRKLPAGRKAEFDGLVEDLRITIVPLSASQATLARAAYQAYGLYSPSRALNFGDCFAYALAKETNLPLLFKGNDFPKTDIRPALVA